MENDEAKDAKGHRETAETILQRVGESVSSGSDAGRHTGAIVGVGHALLAIHDELRAIREQQKERPQRS